MSREQCANQRFGGVELAYRGGVHPDFAAGGRDRAVPFGLTRRIDAVARPGARQPASGQRREHRGGEAVHSERK